MFRSFWPRWTAALLAAAPLLPTLPAGVADDSWHGPACASACPQCVPVPAVRKETHPVYRCAEQSVCLPRRSLWDVLCGRDQGCASCRACPGSAQESCPQCECAPRRKVVLLKKMVTVERPGFQCQPAGPAPPCGP
jgi:hypothetical protein